MKGIVESLVSGHRRRRGDCEYAVRPRESLGQAAGDVCRDGRTTAAPQVTGLTDKTGNSLTRNVDHGDDPRQFDVDYNVEGMSVGYRWFQAKNLKPQFRLDLG